MPIGTVKSIKYESLEAVWLAVTKLWLCGAALINLSESIVYWLLNNDRKFGKEKKDYNRC